MAASILQALKRLLFQVFPIVEATVFECQSKSMIANAPASLDADECHYLQVELTELKESHRAALNQREQMQRRAQAYLLGVTVCSSMTLGAVSLLERVGESGFIIGLMKTFLVIAICCFMMSAYSALRVIGPSQLYDVWLRTQIPPDELTRKANLIRFTKTNETYAFVYETWLRSSFVTMRNGVAILFVFLILIVVV